ncbi:MAG: hypothetical protein H6818_22145 [Phycisphaerales bacterium]|nr:hypothetical protein [Phycisphaerales bacterium]MCB9862494.1 hypothetical protein [Phycisphaerales bacterium]
MINQWLFAGALQLGGMTLLYAIGRRTIDCTTIVLAGYPVGLLLWVLASLIALLTPLTMTAVSATAIALVITVLAITLDSLRRDGAPGTTGRSLLVGAILFNGVSFLIHQVNLTLISNDSFYLLIIARELGHYGYFTDISGLQLSGWGVFAPVAHSASVFLNEGYLYGMPPLLAMVTLALLFHWIRRSFKSLGVGQIAGIVAAVLAALLLLSTPMYQRHASYIHTNLGSAAFLFIYAGAAYMRFSTGGREWLVLAMFGLIGFSLHRVEAPLVAAIFLAPVAESRDIKFVDRLVATLALAGLMTGWFSVIANFIGDKGWIVTREQIPVMLAPSWLLVAVVLASAFRPLQSTTRWTTVLMTWALLLVVLWFFIDKTDHMKKCFDTTAWNLVWTGHWTMTYTVLLFLLAWTPFMRPIRGEALFRATIPAFLLLIVALGAFRKPYRLDDSDSGNRMALHILPAIILYVAVKFGRQFADTRNSRTESEIALDSGNVGIAAGESST